MWLTLPMPARYRSFSAEREAVPPDARGRVVRVDQPLAPPGRAELHRPARVGVLLARAGRLVRPDVMDPLAGLDARLLGLGVALAGA
jgi:hypothetical protein